MTDYIPTIVISRVPGVTSAPLWWPRAQPTDDRQYALDLSQWLDAAIVQATVAVKPSGMGEMQPISVACGSNIVTVRLQGGVAGRIYTVQIQLLTSIDEINWLINIPISDELEIYPPIYPPSGFFGPSILWRQPNLNFSQARNSMYLL